MQKLTGETADEYAKDHLTRIDFTDHGWRQLWKCVECNTYWEMTWNAGKRGFDSGPTELQKLEPETLADKWQIVI